MDSLPDEVLYQICSVLTYEELIPIRVSNKFYNASLESDNFWRNRTMIDFEASYELYSEILSQVRIPRRTYIAIAANSPGHYVPGAELYGNLSKCISDAIHNDEFHHFKRLLKYMNVETGGDIGPFIDKTADFKYLDQFVKHGYDQNNTHIASILDNTKSIEVVRESIKRCELLKSFIIKRNLIRVIGAYGTISDLRSQLPSRAIDLLDYALQFNNRTNIDYLLKYCHDNKINCTGQLIYGAAYGGDAELLYTIFDLVDINQERKYFDALYGIVESPEPNISLFNSIVSKVKNLESFSMFGLLFAANNGRMVAHLLEMGGYIDDDLAGILENCTLDHHTADKIFLCLEKLITLGYPHIDELFCKIFRCTGWEYAGKIFQLYQSTNPEATCYVNEFNNINIISTINFQQVTTFTGLKMFKFFYDPVNFTAEQYRILLQRTVEEDCLLLFRYFLQRSKFPMTDYLESFQTPQFHQYYKMELEK